MTFIFRGGRKWPAGGTLSRYTDYDRLSFLKTSTEQSPIERAAKLNCQAPKAEGGLAPNPISNGSSEMTQVSAPGAGPVLVERLPVWNAEPRLWPVAVRPANQRRLTPFARFVAASRPGPWRGASLQASPGRYAYGRFKEGNLPDVSRVSRRPLVAELVATRPSVPVHRVIRSSRALCRVNVTRIPVLPTSLLHRHLPYKIKSSRRYLVTTPHRH